MSERAWEFAKQWVAANVKRDELEDPSEITELHDHVVALRERLFADAMKQGIAPVEIEEYYDINRTIAETLNESYKREGGRE